MVRCVVRVMFHVGRSGRPIGKLRTTFYSDTSKACTQAVAAASRVHVPSLVGLGKAA
jgi:tRNA U38,U39,U40 pseudouridine synthase TruA